ncbi:hypothetical protein ES708_16586 [subsurface metagenome]
MNNIGYPGISNRESSGVVSIEVSAGVYIGNVSLKYSPISPIPSTARIVKIIIPKIQPEGYENIIMILFPSSGVSGVKGITNIKIIEINREIIENIISNTLHLIFLFPK